MSDGYKSVGCVIAVCIILIVLFTTAASCFNPVVASVVTAPESHPAPTPDHQIWPNIYIPEVRQ